MKGFECPNSIRNYKKKILGTSDSWSTSRLSHRPSEPAYHIVDCRIFRPSGSFINDLAPITIQLSPDLSTMLASKGWILKDQTA